MALDSESKTHAVPFGKGRGKRVGDLDHPTLTSEVFF